MVKRKNNTELQYEICTPVLINKVLTFKTRFFMIMPTKKAEIISTQKHPHLIEFRVDGIKHTRTAEQLIKILNL